VALGNGNYGRVYLVHDPANGRSCTRQPWSVCESSLWQFSYPQRRDINALTFLRYKAGKGRTSSCPDAPRSSSYPAAETKSILKVFRYKPGHPLEVDNAINSAEVEASFEQEAINLRAAQKLPHTAQYVDHFHDPYIGPFIVTTPACESSVERFLERQDRGETDSLTYITTVVFIDQLCSAVHSLHKVRRSSLKGVIAPHPIND
jgi:serine/threonine protein kinase